MLVVRERRLSMDNFRRIGFLRPDDIPSSFQSGDSYVDGDKIAAIIFPIDASSSDALTVQFTLAQNLTFRMGSNKYAYASLPRTNNTLSINNQGEVMGSQTISNQGTYYSLNPAPSTQQIVKSYSGANDYYSTDPCNFWLNKTYYKFPDTWYSFYFDVYNCPYATTTSLPSNWYWKPYVEE